MNLGQSYDAVPMQDFVDVFYSEKSLIFYIGAQETSTSVLYITIIFF